MVFLLCSSGSTLRFENGTAVTFLERRTVLGWPDTCCVSPLQVGNRSPERILAHQWARKYVQIRRPRRLDDMCLFPFIYPLQVISALYGTKISEAQEEMLLAP